MVCPWLWASSQQGGWVLSMHIPRESGQSWAIFYDLALSATHSINSTTVTCSLRLKGREDRLHFLRGGGALHLGRFTQFRAELIDITRGFGGPRAIWLSSSPYPCCGDKILYHEEPILYHFYLPAYLGASMKNIFLSS